MKIFSSSPQSFKHIDDNKGKYQKLSLDPLQDEYVPKIDEGQINKFAKEGARLGFQIGCGLSVIGVPLAMKYSDMTYKKGVKAKMAKKHFQLLRVLLAPALIVGGIGAGVGAGIGAVVGWSKTSKKPG